MNPSSAAATTHSHASLLPRLLGFHAELFRRARRVLWPTIDLAIRLWLAQVFWVSGLLKVTHWQTALDLSANEYPVSWLDPVTAAYTGAGIELVAPLLLAVGLLTRYAAMPLLILSLVIQFNYKAFDTQLFWAAWFGWYAINGAGPISLDQLLRRGLADSALPLAPGVIGMSTWIRVHVGPVYLSAVRLGLAMTLLLSQRLAVSPSGDSGEGWARWLPLATAARVPSALAVAGGVSLLVGLGTRYVAILMLVTGSIGSMMDPSFTGDVFWLALWVLVIVHGAGILSLDTLFGARLKVRYPELAGKPAFNIEGLPRVVIVGAGFGGLSCAAALRRTRVSITLIDRANYHLFQPLLYQVATAAVSPGDIAAPIRPLFRDAFNSRVLLGAVSGIDVTRQCVLVGEKVLPYDYLVLATGAQHSYFGKDQWAPFAPGLKKIEDATEIRRRLLIAFERAESTEDETERRAQLTFLIVGGGPTGVELAGAIAELARFGMEKEFRRFDPASARVILVQSAARVLPSFDEKLSAIAQRSLEKLGVEVMLGSRVEHIDADGVAVSGQRIAARTVLWAAGVMASPAAQWLGAPADNVGRIKVEPNLSVAALPNVFAIGDTALAAAWKGKPVPGLAPAAKQGGLYVAKVIRARVGGLPPPGPFVYRHLGNLATIGRKAAVVDLGPIKLWGTVAWWLWGLVHVGFLVGVRNRIATMTNWFWTYLTFSGGIRLITGGDAEVGKHPREAP